jgi:hypothetical protein
VYVGPYHWGFILLDDTGTEHDRIVFDRGDSVEIVAFNTSAETALEKLPSTVREAIPDHETLEERNEERIPPPPNGDFTTCLRRQTKIIRTTVSPSCRQSGTWATWVRVA